MRRALLLLLLSCEPPQCRPVLCVVCVTPCVTPCATRCHCRPEMMAPLNFSTPAAKPKISFSIDSIVGDDSPADGGKPARVSAASRVSPSPRSPRSPDGSPRCSPVSAAGWSPAGRARSPLRSRSPVWPRAAAAGRPRSPPPLDMEQAKLAAFHHLHSMQQLHSLQHRLHAPEPLHPAALRTPVPGLPGFGLGPLGLARPAVSVASGQPLPPAFGPPHLGGGLPPQTEYPLLPWLYSRQGRLFPSRFPGETHSETENDR